MPDHMQIAMDFAHKPCMFLDESNGSCTIYPVRPLGCRSMTSTKKCTPEDQSGAVGCRFIWDEPAHITVYSVQRKTALVSPRALMIHLQEWLDRSDLID
jgi:Fe-S-cluster containining protein